MKFPLSIFGAAAAAVAAMWQGFAAGAEASPSDDAADGVSPITARQVQRYAYAGATNSEIADLYLIEESMVAGKYKDVLRVGRAMHNIAIRTYQLEAAKKLNASMLTWLGKNDLGQSANPEGPGEELPVVD